jgi:hypothetical protein
LTLCAVGKRAENCRLVFGATLASRKRVSHAAVELCRDCGNVVSGCIAEDVEIHVGNGNGILLFHRSWINPFLPDARAFSVFCFYYTIKKSKRKGLF